MVLRELSLDQFTEALASSAATPGGGSASALSGALAASLVAMVARSTGATGEVADRGALLDDIAAEAEGLRTDLVALVDADAAAFDRVMAAFRLPKETQESKEARSREIQAGYRAAVEPPLLVCRHSLGVLALAGRVAELGNPRMVSDVGVAALLAAGALEGAALNAEINLASIRDERYRAETAATLERDRSEGGALHDQVLATVRERLG